MIDGSRHSIILLEFNPIPWQLRRWRRIAIQRRESGASLLERIEAERPEAPTTPAWLVKYRHDFRQVIDNHAAASILLYLVKCPREMTPLGVWLLGKCGDRFDLHHLRDFCRDDSPQVRKHVAHALWRLDAWHLLAAMAQVWPADDAVQRFAAKANVPLDHRPFDERLKKYSRNVDQSQAIEAPSTSRMPYWALDPTWARTPPKSVAFIRRILRRIHRWVHGATQ